MPGTRNRPYLGLGWKFPLQVNAQGGIAMASDEQRVEESIYMILSTGQGERKMLPSFGCGMWDRVFAPNSAATLAQIESDVRDALVSGEPRIDVLGVSTENAPAQRNLLLIRVDYRIRANQAIGNLVYPFYITEGS
jgi:phage baseplate assembly protein W